MEPIDTREIYLSTAMDLARERGKIMQIVVITHCSTLNRVIPSYGDPVTSEDTPNELHTITNS